jgi:hypothetical protein
VVDRLRTRVLFVLLTLAPAAHLAAQAPRDPAQFAADLQQLAQNLATATPQIAVEIEKAMPAVWQVEHRSRRYDVPAERLRAALRTAAADPVKWPAERAIIVRRLDALAREADALAARAEGAATPDARAALTEVLAGPEFARHQTANAMTRLWQRLVEWFAGIVRRLGLGRVAQAATAEAIAWGVSLVALGALVAWLVRVLRGPSARVRRPHGQPPPETVSARAWARRAASAQDLRETVRCAYRAAMCRLEEEGVWRVDDARTPREYLRLLPEGHRRRQPVSDVARRFEEIWYGSREVTPDDRRTLLGRLRELECLPAE